MTSSSKIPHKQQGAVLVVSLLLLLVMTLLALSASQSTRMQERMAGNARDADMSFQASEAGLRAAEDYIHDLTARPVACSAAPCAVYQKNILAPDLANQLMSWWTATGPANTTEYGTVGSKDLDANLSADPRYVVEEYAYVPDDITAGRGPPTGRVFYRNTAQGVGGSQTARSVVQSTYTRRF